jgi:hypothetical protein
MEREKLVGNGNLFSSKRMIVLFDNSKPEIR